MFSKWTVSLVLVSASLMTACSKSSDDKPKAAPGNELNDYSTCSGPTPARITLYDSWTFKMKRDDNADITTVFKFENNKFTMERTCSMAGGDKTPGSATARSLISVRGREIEVLSNDRGGSLGNGVPCEIEINRAKLTYSFQGSCLKLSDGQEEHLLPLASAAVSPNPGTGGTHSQQSVDYARLILRESNPIADPTSAELVYTLRGKYDKVIKTKTIKCQTSGMVLSAAYPKVTFNVGRLECSDRDSDIQSLLTSLQLLAKVDFNSRTIPGSKNQVLLDLLDYNQDMSQIYKSVTSLNSNITETSAYMYVVAQQRNVDRAEELTVDVSLSPYGKKNLEVQLVSSKGRDSKAELKLVKELN